MTLYEIVEGLQILSRYYENSRGYHCSAEHDVLYAHATDRPVGAEDLRSLLSLGWHQEGVERSGQDGDMAVEDYDPEESWAAYV